MPIEDFAGNVPPIGGGQGYGPPSIPPAYRAPEIVNPPPMISPPSPSPTPVISAPAPQVTPIPDNFFGFLLLLGGLS